MDEPPFDPDHDGPPPPPERRHLHPVRNASDDRTPPADHAAEQAVLGALILDPDLTTTAAQELGRGDFYDLRHQTIWDAIHDVQTRLTGDLRLDSTMLADHLAAQKHDRRGTQLAYIGGAPYLAECVNACPVPGNLPYYAAKVRDTARLREVQEVAAHLQGIVNKADTTDLEGAFTAAYERIDAAVARLGPSTTKTGPPTGLHDLSWLLTGQPPAIPEPRWAQRTDGVALFYPGVVNGIFGDPESAKSWLAQIAIVEALNSGGTAAMIDVDHNGADPTAARLYLLGAKLEDIADQTKFRYYEPESKDELLAATTDITTWAPDVVLIDSIGEVLPMLGVKSVDNDEISTALRTICQPPANAGSCVITIDHLPKSAEARITGYAIGGTAKKRAIRGAYIRAEAKMKPAPGAIGRISLRIEKDTLGGLTKHSPGRYIGEFILDSTNFPQATTWSITRDDSPITEDGRFRPTHLMEAVSRHVEQNDQCTFRDIKDAVRGTDKNLRAAIQCLTDEGFLTTIPGPRNSHLHHAISMYREDQDDQS